MPRLKLPQKLLLSGAFIFTPLISVAQIYKSIGSDGSVHYSDQPNATQSEEVLRIKPKGIPRPRQESPYTKAWQEHLNSEKEAAQHSYLQKQRLNIEQQKQLRCENAKQNLNAIENSVFNRRYIAERTAQIEQAERQVKAECEGNLN